MGFKAQNKTLGEIPKKVDPCPPSLSRDQVIFLLHFIREAEFKGAQLEQIFQLTLKLQEIYTYWENKENN